jgi:uncharacterized protein (DUF1697 family)
MTTYLLLLRGVNVGGKNKVPMSALKHCLEELGFANATTYIASGNVILASDRNPVDIKTQIEAALTTNFELDSDLVKVLVLSHEQLRAVIDRKPAGFGDHPERYHCDTIFLMDMDVAQAMTVFSPREGVDRVWPGEGVIYSERLSSQRTKSRLSKIIGTPAYQSMTIRSWQTTTKLHELMMSRGDR